MRDKRIAVACGGAVVVVALAGLYPLVWPGGNAAVTETLLGVLHDNIRQPTTSERGCNFAYSTTVGDKRLVVADGKPGPSSHRDDPKIAQRFIAGNGSNHNKESRQGRLKRYPIAASPSWCGDSRVSVYV